MHMDSLLFTREEKEAIAFVPKNSGTHQPESYLDQAKASSKEARLGRLTAVWVFVTLPMLYEYHTIAPIHRLLILREIIPWQNFI